MNASLLSAKVSHAYQASPLLATLDYAADQATPLSVASSAPALSRATSAATAPHAGSESVTVTLGQQGPVLALYSQVGRILDAAHRHENPPDMDANLL